MRQVVDQEEGHRKCCRGLAKNHPVAVASYAIDIMMEDQTSLIVGEGYRRAKRLISSCLCLIDVFPTTTTIGR